MPLGVDPRPKDPSTWILWEYVSASEKGKFIERKRYLNGAFLTQFGCERASIAELQLQRVLTEKLEDERKTASKRKIEYHYDCRPVGVNPND